MVAGADSMVLGRNEAAVAVLHDDWAVRGHAMIVARRHVENVSDLDDEEARAFLTLHRTLERALLEQLHVERVVLLKLGLAVPHLHLHLYPVSRNMTRAEIFAAINLERGEKMTDAERQAFAGRLRAALA